jgi:hypothetical protein
MKRERKSRRLGKKRSKARLDCRERLVNEQKAREAENSLGPFGRLLHLTGSGAGPKPGPAKEAAPEESACEPRERGLAALGEGGAMKGAPGGKERGRASEGPGSAPLKGVRGFPAGMAPMGLEPAEMAPAEMELLGWPGKAPAMALENGLAAGPAPEPGPGIGEPGAMDDDFKLDKIIRPRETKAFDQAPELDETYKLDEKSELDETCKLDETAKLDEIIKLGEKLGLGQARAASRNSRPSEKGSEASKKKPAKKALTDDDFIRAAHEPEMRILIGELVGYFKEMALTKDNRKPRRAA